MLDVSELPSATSPTRKDIKEMDGSMVSKEPTNKWVFPKIGGFPPKSSILIGFSIIFTIHFGVSLFLETPKWGILGVITHLLNLDPNFLGHTSRFFGKESEDPSRLFVGSW